MATEEPPATVSKLPLLIIGAVVGLAVLVTVALIATSDTETYEPGTPEAALQDFLQAGFDGDSDAMFGLLTADSRAACETTRDQERFDEGSDSDGLRAELEGMTVEGATATAEVRFEHSSGNDPFDNSSWSYNERFRLERVDGAWLIDRAGWPWPFEDCTRGL